MTAERENIAPVYLRLFHGRKCKAQDMDNWGTDGPILGPLSFVHTTYGCHIHLGDANYPWDTVAELTIMDGLVYYDGVYYGDWSVWAGPIEESMGLPVLPEEAKANPPQ